MLPHPKRPEHHVVPGSLSERVPVRGWGAFGDTVGSLLSRVLTTTTTACTKATTALCCLLGQTFYDGKGSRNRYRQVQARCAKVQAGESLEPTLLCPSRPNSRSPELDNALAEAIHHDRKLGSVKRAP